MSKNILPLLGVAMLAFMSACGDSKENSNQENVESLQITKNVAPLQEELAKAKENITEMETNTKVVLDNDNQEIIPSNTYNDFYMDLCEEIDESLYDLSMKSETTDYGLLGMYAAGIRGLWYFSSFPRKLANHTGIEYSNSGNHKLYRDPILTEVSGGTPLFSRTVDQPYNNYKDFNRVNIEYIKWIRQNVIPEPNSMIRTYYASEIYHLVFENFFRMHTQSYLFLENNNSSAHVIAYQNVMNEPANNHSRYMLDYLATKYSGEFKGIYRNPLKISYTALNYGTTTGFWLRRKIDNSYQEIANTLVAFMKLYDNDWYQKEKLFFENTNQGERDSTIIEGTLQFIDHAPTADMMFLGLSIDGNLKFFDYSYIGGPNKIQEVDKLLNKKVILKSNTKYDYVEVDLHVNGVSVLGEKGYLKTDKRLEKFSSIEGMITVTEADLPHYLITKNNGTVLQISGEEINEYLAYDGKIVSVYFIEDKRDEVIWISLPEQPEKKLNSATEQKNITSFSELLNSDLAVDSTYQKVQYELGNTEDIFTYSFSFKNIEEAIAVFKRINMLELDDYRPENMPASSSRSIDFELNNNDSQKISNVSINSKPVALKVGEYSKDNLKVYEGPTSDIKSYEYDGRIGQYSDFISFTLAYNEGELVSFRLISGLKGYLSDDEIISANPNNRMTISELRAADSGVENSVYAECNGYESSVKISKTNSDTFNVVFSVSTYGCAL